MNNPDDTKNPKQAPSQSPSEEPTDQGEDSEQRRDAAEKVWRDRERVTPEVHKPEDIDDIDEKR
jgi:hypothetical protein